MENEEIALFNTTMNQLKLTILEHGHLHAGTDWTFYDLRSPFNRMYFVESGSGSIYSERNKLNLEGNYVYFVPLSEVFSYVCDGHLHMFYIHFRLELIPGYDVFSEMNQCLCIKAQDKVIQSLIQHATAMEVCDVLKCKGIFYTYLGLFAKKIHGYINEQIKLSGEDKDVYEYIHKNCYGDLRIKQIAQDFGMHPSTFSKGFKKRTGMTLKTYIDQKLIRKMQEQLLITEKTICTIAVEMHFSDEFHFSRYFKKHVGMSPSVYRERSNTFK